jgi:hypothetical protein
MWLHYALTKFLKLNLVTMKKYLKISVYMMLLVIALGANFKQQASKEQPSQIGLELFANSASAQSSDMWGVALPPYYCGCPSGIAAGCYCVIF